FKLDRSAILTRVAGNSRVGYSGDGGPAASAQLSFPVGVAVDSTNNLYIADSGNGRIRRVSPAGAITTVAGGGINYPGDGSLAISAQLSNPSGVAVDSAGNLYIADGGSRRIRRVSPGGTITTVAGNGSIGYLGDGGPAISAQLAFPYGVG